MSEKILTEYRAEAYYRESPFAAEERWMVKIPSRLVRRGDLVSTEGPWGALRKVRWAGLFHWIYNPDFEVYIDARHTRGYVIRA